MQQGGDGRNIEGKGLGRGGESHFPLGLPAPRRWGSRFARRSSRPSPMGEPLCPSVYPPLADGGASPPTCLFGGVPAPHRGGSRSARRFVHPSPTGEPLRLRSNRPSPAAGPTSEPHHQPPIFAGNRGVTSGLYLPVPTAESPSEVPVG